MVNVIQIHKSKALIEKYNYNAHSRNMFHQWDNEIVSKKGYFNKGTLYLSNQEQLPSISNLGLIVLQNVKTIENTISLSQKNSALNQSLGSFKNPLRSCDFDIFGIEKNVNGDFNISLNYETNAFYIGLPKRSNHKIAQLKLNESIRYQINGKSDFTLTGRSQRIFIEYDYIIQYLGNAKRIEFVTEQELSFTKKIPLEKAKCIDERKFLN